MQYIFYFQNSQSQHPSNLSLSGKGTPYPFATDSGIEYRNLVFPAELTPAQRDEVHTILQNDGIMDADWLNYFVVIHKEG